MFKRRELVPLSFFRHLVEGAEEFLESILTETLENSGRPGHLAIAKSDVKPPREFFRQPRKTPVAELRNQQGFMAGALRVSEGTKAPVRAIGKIIQPLIPVSYLVRHGVVLVKVLDIRLDVKIALAGAVVHDQPA